ncbi:pilus assembly protein PilZ [Rhodobacteraceae bacterium RKSG542]|uniref:PilZ domain-containing protein n=1 Tax=Pseudovibrio flavus TaxID=2529854 RepID=UPI0012BB8287|nr:PilZ domain-containing protein [Pseudovibrio flavus]MTI17634.1 pilus assembly protein PilZ [Pseudovibrio flavus]
MTDSIEQGDGSERRIALRRRTLKEGRIVFGDLHNKTISCTIRDMSDTGARIQVESTQDIPESFYLYIVQSRQRAVVEVRWRTMTSMGVEFFEPLKDIPRAMKI